MNALPTDAQERKRHPMYSGLVAYFPRALAAVSHLSWLGNEQHHPGTPLHWDKSKSSDELDALMRHLTDEEWVHVAWRALANLERKLDAGWQPWPRTLGNMPSHTNTHAHRGVGEGDAGMDDPPEVKAGLPKLPDGWVYYGKGKYSNDGWRAHRDDTGYCGTLTSKWFLGSGAATGQCPHCHYAIRRGSEIAKLNGL